MPLSVGELKKVSVQSIRDIATGLHAKATSMRATLNWQRTSTLRLRRATPVATSPTQA